MTIVVAGVGVLFSGHVVGEGELCTAVQNRQTILEVCLCVSLDLSCTQTCKAKCARSCSTGGLLKANL